MTRWTTLLYLTAFLLLGQQSSGQTNDSLDNIYNTTIAGADSLFAKIKWPEETQTKEARLVYIKATAIYPARQYPKDMIALCNKILNITKYEPSSYEEQKYNDYIIQADWLFIKKDYVLAKIFYQNALEIFKDEKYPQDRVVLCDKLIKEE